MSKRHQHTGPKQQVDLVTPPHEVTQRWGLVAEQVGRVAVSAFKWSIVALIAYMALGTLEKIAGTETSVSIIVDWAASLSLPSWFGGLFGVGGILYGNRQNREKRRKTEAMAKRIIELETRIDPERTSSQLTEDGRTNPADH